MGLIRHLSRTSCSKANAFTHQWRHVSSVHLPCGDLLLGGGHGSHIEGVRTANGPRPYYTRKCYWAVFHPTNTIELLLQNCGPSTEEKEKEAANFTVKHATITKQFHCVTVHTSRGFIHMLPFKAMGLNGSMCVVKKHIIENQTWNTLQLLLRASDCVLMKCAFRQIFYRMYLCLRL